jgi:surfactin synthase thioesterase subunit
LRILQREEPGLHARVCWVMVGGRAAPHLSQPSQYIRNLTHDQFIEQLRRLGGTPEEVLNSVPLMKMMVPIVRADWVMSEEYVPDTSEQRYRVSAPLVYFGGETDPIGRERQERWREVCSDPTTFTVHFFEGGHFFVHSHQALLLERIAATLRGSTTHQE